VEGNNIHNLILRDFSNIRWLFAPGTEYDQSGLLADSWNLGYCRDENNFMVIRICAMLSFITFGKYLITCLFFSMVSYSGVWRLFRFFYEQFPHLHKQIAISILYFPTFVFWCSGMLKDPLCVGAMGWITYSLYELFYKKKHILSNLVIVFLASYLLSTLKVYILISYVPFFMMFLVLKNVDLIKNIFVKIAFLLVLVVGSVLGFTKVMSELQGSLSEFTGEGLTKSIKTYQQAYEAQDFAQSNFKLGVEFDGSVGSLVKIAPMAIFATLYRPFIWESKKPSTLLTSFESLAIIIFTLRVLWMVGFIKFFKSARDPAVLYCFLFALLFALFVGATTQNFGTLCRYKIPCIPFYMIALFIILDKNGLLKLKKPAVIPA
jgi:hypothetical protein